MDKIYNFNPKLDGGTLDIRDAGQTPLVQAGQDAVEALWPKLTVYLNADTAPGFDQAGGDRPVPLRLRQGPQVRRARGPDRHLAERAEGGSRPGHADRGDGVRERGPHRPAGRREHPRHPRQLRLLQDRGQPPAHHDAGLLGRARSSAATSSRTPTPREGWRIQSITYPELVDILDSEGDFIILFGGTWCHNTRAVIKAVNEYAQANGITKVYNFDLSLDSTGNGGANYLHVRDNHFRTVSGTTTNNLRASYLYGDLVEKYFTNLKTQYGPSASTVSYFPGGDTSREVKTAQKLQVPFPIHYNKDHRDAQGNPAPVEHQWIQTNTNTETGAVSYKEYMTEWWWVLGNLDGPYTPGTAGWTNNVPAQRAFAAEGIAEPGPLLHAVRRWLREHHDRHRPARDLGRRRGPAGAGHRRRAGARQPSRPARSRRWPAPR